MFGYMFNETFRDLQLSFIYFIGRKNMFYRTEKIGCEKIQKSGILYQFILIRGRFDKVNIARHNDLTLQIRLIGYETFIT